MNLSNEEVEMLETLIKEHIVNNINALSPQETNAFMDMDNFIKQCEEKNPEALDVRKKVREIINSKILKLFALNKKFMD